MMKLEMNIHLLYIHYAFVKEERTAVSVPRRICIHHEMPAINLYPSVYVLPSSSVHIYASARARVWKIMVATWTSHTTKRGQLRAKCTLLHCGWEKRGLSCGMSESDSQTDCVLEILNVVLAIFVLMAMMVNLMCRYGGVCGH